MYSPASSNSIELTPFRVRSDVHLTRKIWHMGTGFLGLYLYRVLHADPIATGIVFLTVALVGFTIDFIRLRNVFVNRLALNLMRPFMRESEKNSFSGFPFYALGVSLSLFLFPEKLAVLSIAYLVFSDPISSYVGIRFGKDKILPNKSLQGSLAGFATCYFLTLFYGLAYGEASFALLVMAFFGGLIGSLSEVLSHFNIDDNLTIPVISGFGLTLINFFLNIF